jgi:hypothetical protein
MTKQRNFAPITIDELIVKINLATNNLEDPLDESAAGLIAHLGDDITVSFGLKNFSNSVKLAAILENLNDKKINDFFLGYNFGPKALLGYHTEHNGLTWCGFCACDRTEHPVFFCVYWDGNKLRGYVPKQGNLYNSDTNQAYGHHLDYDCKNIQKRWPEQFDDETRRQIVKMRKIEVFNSLEFNPNLILQELNEKILPPGQKAVKKVVAPKPKKPKPRFKNPEVKTIPERIKSLVFYIGDNKGTNTDLFKSICSASYLLYKEGTYGKAEIACVWAEEMAAESRVLYGDSKNTLTGL